MLRMARVLLPWMSHHRPLLKCPSVAGLELRGGTSPQGRLEVSTKDGKILDCALASFNGSSGLEAGKVAVLHDITHIKEIDALKSEFVSNVSHDLRSPLAYMTNYAALIPTQGQLEPKQQEWLDRIVSGIEEMTSLLDLQRLDAFIALQMTEFKLENLVKAVVGEYRQHASEQGISIELHMGSDYPPITGDPDLIRQSLRNLLSNAIKYAPDSGGLPARMALLVVTTGPLISYVYGGVTVGSATGHKATPFQGIKLTGNQQIRDFRTTSVSSGTVAGLTATYFR